MRKNIYNGKLALLFTLLTFTTSSGVFADDEGLPCLEATEQAPANEVEISENEDTSVQNGNLSLSDLSQNPETDSNSMSVTDSSSPSSDLSAPAHKVSANSDQVVINMDIYDDYCDNIFYPEDRAQAYPIWSFDLTYVKSIFDPREAVFPMTKRKAAFWCGFAAIGAGIAVLENTVGVSEHLVQAANYISTPLMIAIYGTEPIFSMLDLLVAKYSNPALPVDERPSDASLKEIALVIPAHNSAAIIKKTLESALKYLGPEQIFIVDNGSTEHPTDNTKEKVKAISPKIHYIWQSLPNKTLAQYAGTKAAAKKGYKYIMTTDDDVTLPSNFDFCIDKLNDEVKAVCFPIRAVTVTGEPSILVDWQDVEYQASDLAKLAEGRFSGTQYPHGAGSLWETDTLLKILRDHHDTIFHAEDMKLGIGLAALGKKMHMCSTTALATDAPSCIFGTKPNYWQQRVRCWEMTRHFMLPQAIKRLVTPFGSGKETSVVGFIMKKKNQASLVLTTVTDWVRLPVTVIFAMNPNYWIKLGIFNAASIVPPLLLNYAGPLDGRPDLKVSFRAIVTYPIYKILHSTVSTAGALRAIFIYEPNFAPKPTILDLEKARDPRCVWLLPEAEAIEPAALNSQEN